MNGIVFIWSILYTNASLNFFTVYIYIFLKDLPTDTDIEMLCYLKSEFYRQ